MILAGMVPLSLMQIPYFGKMCNVSVATKHLCCTSEMSFQVLRKFAGRNLFHRFNNLGIIQVIFSHCCHSGCYFAYHLYNHEFVSNNGNKSDAVMGGLYVGSAKSGRNDMSRTQFRIRERLLWRWLLGH